MNRTSLRYAVSAMALVATLAIGNAGAADPVALDPKAVVYKLPSQIPWMEVSAIPGLKIATLAGNPSKPELYVQLIHWPPNRMSRPHYHANDRFITVLSGTWWVGSGTKFDPDKTVPMPPGSFVTHFAKQVHYDGAKDSEAVIEVVGIGPAAMIPAEDK
jgi:hypothetical protein